MKKTIKYVIVFLTPILLFLISYYLLGYRIKNENFVISDMKGQYVSLFSYLQDVLKGEENILYSFQKGMGGSMIATYAYYLASPFNLILLFFSKANIPYAIFMLLLIKMGLSSFTMYLYLNKRNLNNCFLFSVAYALMGYMVQYYMHIMWLDALYLFPLLLLGIDKIIQKNKHQIYIVILFLSIVSNFYIGYMCILFSFFYFLLQMKFQNKNLKSKLTLYFIMDTLLAGFLTFFLLLPTILELRNVYRYPIENLWNFKSILANIGGLFSKLYIGAHNCKNFLNANGTNLYCGTFTIFLVFLFFTNHNIDKKKKKIYGIFLLFLFLNSVFPFFIYIWHGFSLPNYFSNRNSFLFTFVLILIAIESYQNEMSISLKQGIYLMIGFIIISFLLYGRNYDYLQLQEIGITGIFLLLYYIIFYQKKYNHLFSFVFVILSLFEIGLNTIFTLQGVNENTLFHIALSTYDQLNMDSNYRFTNRNAYSGLDSFFVKTSSITSFISTNTKQEHRFLSQVGYPTTGITHIDNNTNTIVMDSLLGIQKTLSSQKSIGYVAIESIDWMTQKTNLYENPYALAIGYQILNNTECKTENSFECQNKLIKSFSGVDENPLELVFSMKIKGENKIIIPEGEYYIQIQYGKGDTLKKELAKITINERTVSDFEANGIFQVSNSKESVILIEDIKPGITLEEIFVYQLNQEIFEKQIKQLQFHQLQNVKKQKNKLTASITLEKSGLLFLSIPYDKGWQVFIDGNENKIIPVIDTFIGISLESGIHEIVLKYTPIGLYEGFVISIISLGILILHFKIVKNSKV